MNRFCLLCGGAKQYANWEYTSALTLSDRMDLQVPVNAVQGWWRNLILVNQDFTFGANRKTDILIWRGESVRLLVTPNCRVSQVLWEHGCQTAIMYKPPVQRTTLAMHYTTKGEKSRSIYNKVVFLPFFRSWLLRSWSNGEWVTRAETGWSCCRKGREMMSGFVCVRWW